MTDFQTFLEQRWVYSGSAEKSSLGSAAMGSQMLIPTSSGKRTLNTEGQRKVGGYSKQRVHGFPLAESSPGKERKRESSSCWAL